tara:strand:- start:69 stop:317 length:249 start_codon:yes stop_codon:yes gene_type:complete
MKIPVEVLWVVEYPNSHFKWFSDYRVAIEYWREVYDTEELPKVGECFYKHLIEFNLEGIVDFLNHKEKKSPGERYKIPITIE